jgi:uncharacterized protein Usg
MPSSLAFPTAHPATSRIADGDFLKRLSGASLVTADILYWLPDHPTVLQQFVWQTLDQAPRFPRVLHFLDYWVKHIEGTLHSVSLAHAGLVKPAEVRLVDGEFRLH